LEAAFVEPSHVGDEQAFHFRRGQPGLTRRWESIAHEVHGLVESVHRSWRDAVEPVRLPADR